MLNVLFFSRVTKIWGSHIHEYSALLNIAICFPQWFPIQDWFHDSCHYGPQRQRRWVKSATKKPVQQAQNLLFYLTICYLVVEFSRRWCTLNDGIFSYYESDRSSTPNGALKASEIVCLAVDMLKKHGYAPNSYSFIHVFWHQLYLFYIPRYNHTFEVYSERLYLFGTDDPETHKEWVNSIAKVIYSGVKFRCRAFYNLAVT